VPHFNQAALKEAKTYLNVTKKFKKLDNNDFKYPILNKMIAKNFLNTVKHVFKKYLVEV
jgi:hypothetical protein